MPMPNNQWESALRGLQPHLGHVANPMAAGNTGNVPYAPGMMSAYRGQAVPPAGALYRGAYPGGSNPGGMTPASPQGGGYGGGYPGMNQRQMGYGPGMSGPQSRGFLDALQRVLSARGGVAATRGANPAGALSRPY